MHDAGDNVGQAARAVVIMGPAGAGKTTVGLQLATHVGAQFIDADAYHSADNIDKMRRGQALTDEDRWSWLEQLRQLLH
ncbi:MAG TPA: gluconokinase, partial [Polyangiaceae bacterium]|nr:gluconokinase [Polyangiaceae bacterium]